MRTRIALVILLSFVSFSIAAPQQPPTASSETNPSSFRALFEAKRAEIAQRPKPPAPAADDGALETRLAALASVQLTRTPRQTFETLCDIARVTCVFHRQFQDGPATNLSVDKVEIGAAFNAVAARSGNFWRIQKSFDAIVIAADNPATRQDLASFIEWKSGAPRQ
jgi:hypothetical protein